MKKIYKLQKIKNYATLAVAETTWKFVKRNKNRMWATYIEVRSIMLWKVLAKKGILCEKKKKDCQCELQ